MNDHDLGVDITHYGSDIRAVADTALTSSLPSEPGLFRLDLTHHNAPQDERRALHERRENPMTTTPRVGDRVRITGLLPADPAPLEIGTTGTVTHINDLCPGQIFVDWDNGRALILLDTDPFEILPAASADKPQRPRGCWGRPPGRPQRGRLPRSSRRDRLAMAVRLSVRHPSGAREYY
ncbi:DUF4314 domain-containing protein [Nocardia speluncae]|uniref:DUF4314 domain-containing protein n=1 Tax=Nocardia speluncae TaxID=419477 RepID=A0A846XCP9_9NOCA|nr:DUF4314 domain-containing protein [Nocardia speluncae]NKY33838.1 DUF4314 domain-containing protein [Nocardia speluncae]